MREKSLKKNWIFFVPETLPSFAGTGRNAFNFARFLNTKNFNVTIVTLNRNLKLKSKETIENVVILRIPYFAFNLITKAFSLFLILPIYLYHIVKNEAIFIYSSHLVGYQCIIILSIFLRKKVIFRSTIHSEDDISSLVRKKITGRLNKFAFKRITLYFSINQAFTKSYLKVFKDPLKIFEIPQGIDENCFNRPTIKQKELLRKQLGLPLNQKIIISVGYLIKRKGYEETFYQLSKINTEFLYIVVGDYKPGIGHFMAQKEIEEMKFLYNLGKELLKNKLKFIGSKSNIYDYFRSSDIFIHNATREGLPNVLLEAMACGLPVIIKNLEGISGFLLSHINNALVFENPDDIATYLNKCLKNQELYKKLSANANNTILNSFTFKIVSEKLIDKLYSYK